MVGFRACMAHLKVFAKFSAKYTRDTHATRACKPMYSTHGNHYTEFTASIIPHRKHAEANLILKYFILFFREKTFITSASR